MDYNWIIEKIYKAFLKKGDIAIDVGAYHGRHTFPMAESVAPTGRVLAFEPVPESRKILHKKLNKEHRKLRQIVSIYPHALAAYDGNAEFTVAIDALEYSGLRKRVYDGPTRLKKVFVPIKTIDSICSGLATLKIIKIDVEGGEFHVLKGAEEAIEKFRPLIIFEFGEEAFREYQITPADMANFWAKRDYKIYDLLGYYLEPEIFIQRVHRGGKVWDYVALPKELQAFEKKLVDILERSQKKLYGIPRYSVIVPTYNREESLRKTLISLAGQTIPSDQYEVLVIDDGSSRNIKDVFEKFSRQYGAKNFFYHRISHGGPSKARNVGIKLARGEILFFTDDDCVVPPNWMETLLGGYRRHPKAVGVGGWEMKNPLVLARNRIAQYMHSYDLDLLDRRRPIQQEPAFLQRLRAVRPEASRRSGSPDEHALRRRARLHGAGRADVPGRVLPSDEPLL